MVVDFFYKQGTKIFQKKRKHEFYGVRELKTVLNSYFSELHLSDTLTDIIVPCIRLNPDQKVVFNSREAMKSLSYDFQMQNVILAACGGGYHFPSSSFENLSHTKKNTYGGFKSPYNPVNDVYTMLLAKTKNDKKNMRLLSLGATVFKDKDLDNKVRFDDIDDLIKHELSSSNVTKYQRVMPKIVEKYGDMDDTRHELLDFYSQEAEKFVEE